MPLAFTQEDFLVSTCFNLQIVTDSHMQVEGTSQGSVFAIGDCADIKGQPLPCTAQVN